MGGVDLPLVDPATPIADALEMLRVRRRAAVVMHLSGGSVLVTIGHLGTAKRAGKLLVGEADATITLPASSTEHFVSGFLGHAGTSALTSVAASAFGSVQFLAGPTMFDTALVITASEVDAKWLTAGFACNGVAPVNGDPTHFFDDLPRTPNSECPDCTTPSGKKPPVVRAFV